VQKASGLKISQKIDVKIMLFKGNGFKSRHIQNMVMIVIDSQSMLREICSSGSPILIKINILCLASTNIFWVVRAPEKFGNHCIRHCSTDLGAASYHAKGYLRIPHRVVIILDSLFVSTSFNLNKIKSSLSHVI
jgi:hypothetical protein